MNNLSSVITYDNEFFWDAAKNKKLTFQKCKKCGHVIWPPSNICPICYSKDITTITSKGRGKIYSFAVFRVPFHESVKENIPYVLAVVELEEGPMIVSNIVNCSPENLKCGSKVKLIWETIGDLNIFKFEPA